MSQHLFYLAGVTPRLRITGLKRDLALLKKLPQDHAGPVIGFDLAFGPNAEAAQAFLAKGHQPLAWFDHHEPGPLPQSPRFTPFIQAQKGLCTAMIVNATLGQAFPLWAAMAAYGDNVTGAAEAMLAAQGVAKDQAEAIAETGRLLNYNAYGEEKDTLFAPLTLAEGLMAFESALDFIAQSPWIPALRAQWQADEAHFAALKPWRENASARVYVLDDAPWARRFAASWVNALSRSRPDLASAILTPDGTQHFTVSLRAPKTGPHAHFEASRFASAWPKGGGRPQAAGINALPVSEAERLANSFLAEFA